MIEREAVQAGIIVVVKGEYGDWWIGKVSKVLPDADKVYLEWIDGYETVHDSCYLSVLQEHYELIDEADVPLYVLANLGKPHSISHRVNS